MNKPTIKGILPPIPTPFDPDGSILHGKLRSNLARWFAAGLHGVVVLGSNGESVMLNEDEKLKVWEAARDAIPRDRLFIAGTGAESTAATIALTRGASRLGADVALIVTPHYYRGQMTSAAMVRHYRSVADAAPIPVLIYNVPANTGVDLDAATLIELASHENIIGAKDSSGNFAKMGQVIHSVKPEFAFLAGSGSFIFPALSIGAKGAVPALGNVAPAQCVEMYESFQRGDLHTSRELQLRLVRLNDAVTSRWSVPGLKAALDQVGYYGGPPRPPLLPLGDAERETLQGILRQAGILAEANALA